MSIVFFLKHQSFHLRNWKTVQENYITTLLRSISQVDSASLNRQVDGKARQNCASKELSKRLFQDTWVGLLALLELGLCWYKPHMERLELDLYPLHSPLIQCLHWKWRIHFFWMTGWHSNITPSQPATKSKRLHNSILGIHLGFLDFGSHLDVHSIWNLYIYILCLPHEYRFCKCKDKEI